MFRVYLGLGSNVGDRISFLSKALKELNNITRVGRVSSVYETEPWGVEGQNRFFNLVVEVETNLYPLELLEKIQTIEKKLGRKKDSHMKPRTMDIDILFYNGWSFENNVITIPHPELERRRFVLEPISEIAPMAVHPSLGKTMISLLRHCRDRSLVMRTNNTLLK
ncbi:MAG: 2-amino-4-hydroxy-6-hydroxymethyldihydropteridine diphosphokinase [Bacteroidetes bacterium]|nr:2-amino-4-hydroxy-6-hydroxymethyldihydropteridine diphosphokinase [Bacteroidota bacterium]MBU1423760.1 2-amino-4-hydroxy-6-hydroxymethyldihydropteridine diphosphokinase [Bacteroidota bacterium]MBU2472130.1 2-amino-4-hydroxy-6-hydroxymethyldihydropteridine diphosphokinase [Bacteroidota bacterium]MBU2635859.1 2-amino-4-hydroxy-6-hydroxymethyldihydropteridine diphosphokinase [Bacteroidota bacterium]